MENKKRSILQRMDVEACQEAFINIKGELLCTNPQNFEKISPTLQDMIKFLKLRLDQPDLELLLSGFETLDYMKIIEACNIGIENFSIVNYYKN